MTERVLNCHGMIGNVKQDPFGERLNGFFRSGGGELSDSMKEFCGYFIPRWCGSIGDDWLMVDV